MTHTYTVNGLTCSGCANKVKSQLEQHPYVTSADISLEKNMAKLTMDRHVTTEELQGLLGPNSQYTISSTTKQPHDTEQEKNGFTTYKPLLLIFLFITVVSAIASIDSGQIEPMQWMGYFMGGFFIVFSFFKFLDLNGFADSYAMYDVLAKRVKAYGLAYPFIELALGIAYLTHFEPKITYITTIAVMGFSSIGVIQSVLDKRKIRCACLGAVFNLPMSTVTIIENLLMVVMAAFMLAAT
jgi:copper chaperone CopZ